MLDNEKNLREICALLNAEGFRGPAGKPVAKHNLSCAFANPLMYGSWRINIADPEGHQELEGRSVPVFSKAETLRIREILQNRKIRRRNPEWMRRTYIFQDLLRCGEPFEAASAARPTRPVPRDAPQRTTSTCGYRHSPLGCMGGIELRRPGHSEPHLLRLIDPMLKRWIPLRTRSAPRVLPQARGPGR